MSTQHVTVVVQHMTLLSLCCARDPVRVYLITQHCIMTLNVVYNQYMNTGYAQVLGYSRVYMHGTIRVGGLCMCVGGLCMCVGGLCMCVGGLCMCVGGLCMCDN